MIQEATVGWSDMHAREGQDPIAWAPINRAVASALSPFRAYSCAALASGGVWTQSKLHQRGGADTSTCQLCHKEEGTLEHRLLHCEGWAIERRKYLPELTRCWVLEVALPQLWSPDCTAALPPEANAAPAHA
eukprot:5417996-Amphidinium_carterae.1